MIVLDPLLDAPDPAPSRGTLSSGQTQPGIPRTTASQALDRQYRIPTARTLTRFLKQAQAAVRLPGQVTVLLTTDGAIKTLNRRFRGKNKPTDVLSFPASPEVAREVAGDLAISVPTARRQAAEHGHSVSIEIKVLVLHGLLHLAGYDHEADEGQMARREQLLRARLRLPQGLIERTTAAPPPRRSKVTVKVQARTSGRRRA